MKQKMVEQFNFDRLRLPVTEDNTLLQTLFTTCQLSPSLPTFSGADWLTGGVREGGWLPVGVQVHAVHRGSVNKAA